MVDHRELMLKYFESSFAHRYVHICWRLVASKEDNEICHILNCLFILII